ncbi:MAG: hypothetical protein AAB074_00870 [Planctomycetota bacterium]
MVLFLHITSHVEEDQYQELFEAKGGDGFPYMAYLDSAGEVISKFDRPYTVDTFSEALKKAESFIAMVKKAEGGDKAAALEVLIGKLETGAIKADEAKKKLKDLPKPSAEQEPRLNGALANAEVQQILDEQEAATAKKFMEMLKAKRAPTDKEVGQTFYMAILNYSEKEKDAAGFEAALNGLKAMFGDNPQAKGFFDAKEKTLKKLKSEKDPK